MNSVYTKFITVLSKVFKLLLYQYYTQDKKESMTNQKRVRTLLPDDFLTAILHLNSVRECSEKYI
jgi:hypothetical protein